jgi:cytosine deaminase
MTLLQAMHIPPAVRGFNSTAPEGTVFNVSWAGGHVTTIEPCAPGTEAVGLLLPTLVDIHLHLDKTHTVHETGAANGDLFRAIEMIAQHRETWTEAEWHLLWRHDVEVTGVSD